MLVVAGPSADPRSLATLRRLSRGRLRVVADEGAEAVFTPIPDQPGAYEEPRPDSPPDRWVTVAAPMGRAAWRETLLAATELGCRGVLVPADSRLLDILRNPDEDGDRRDLFLAAG